MEGKKVTKATLYFETIGARSHFMKKLDEAKKTGKVLEYNGKKLGVVTKNTRWTYHVDPKKYKPWVLEVFW